MPNKPGNMTDNYNEGTQPFYNRDTQASAHGPDSTCSPESSDLLPTGLEIWWQTAVGLLPQDQIYEPMGSPKPCVLIRHPIPVLVARQGQCQVPEPSLPHAEIGSGQPQGPIPVGRIGQGQCQASRDQSVCGGQEGAVLGPRAHSWHAGLYPSPHTRPAPLIWPTGPKGWRTTVLHYIISFSPRIFSTTVNMAHR